MIQKKLLMAAAGFLALNMFSITAYGQIGASPENGLKLAKSLCTNCHVVDSGKDSIAREVAPSFRSIASIEGQTSELLAGKIIIPHPDMPSVPLTRNEIRDIIAYILSLKTDKK